MAQAYTARARRSASKHVVPASLILAGIVPLPAQAADLQLVYLANFHNGSLDPSFGTGGRRSPEGGCRGAGLESARDAEGGSH